jgi:anti-sigma-K factor RskA
MNQHDREFEQRVRSALDSSVDGLDTATRSRLAAMRARVGERQSLLQRWLGAGHWLPAAALAASVTLAIAIAIRPSSAPTPEPSLLAEADIALELLLDDEVQESDSDPDFYVWLDVVLAEEGAVHES